MSHPTDNYIDVDVFVSDATDIESIASIKLYLSVDGTKSSPYEVFYDPDLDVTFVVIPDTVGLGKAYFYGSMVYYDPELAKAATWDSTDSNSFYVRRDIYPEANADVELSPSGYTKTFTVNAMGIYSPSIDSFRALSSIKLQYKTSDGWKTKKTIYPDLNGNATYSFGRTTKFYYRIISSRTSTWVGFTKTFPKI